MNHDIVLCGTVIKKLKVPVADSTDSQYGSEEDESSPLESVHACFLAQVDIII